MSFGRGFVLWSIVGSLSLISGVSRANFIGDGANVRARKPSVAKEKTGGSHGGGGGVQVDSVTPEEIKKAIVETKPSLRAFFRSLEFATPTLTAYQDTLDPTTRAKLQTLHNKLFPKKNGQGIYEVIESLELAPIDRGACYNAYGKERDASTSNTENPNSICYSLERLAKTLARGDFHLQILALSGHEFAHKVQGVTDAEVELIQDTILATVSDKAAAQLSARQSSLLVSVTELSTELDRVIDSTRSGKERLQVCSLDMARLLASFSAVRERAVGTYSELGLMVLDLNHSLLLAGLVIKTVVAMGYCIPEESAQKDAMKIIFGDSKRIPLERVAETVRMSWAPGTDAIFASYIPFADDAAMVVELSEIRAYLTKVKKELF